MVDFFVDVRPGVALAFVAAGFAADVDALVRFAPADVPFLVADDDPFLVVDDVPVFAADDVPDFGVAARVDGDFALAVVLELAFDEPPVERREVVFLSPIGNTSPTAFTAPLATSPTVPAILPAVLPTRLTTLPASGIGHPPASSALRSQRWRG